MSITPDKKAGELTGRFRVELQKGTLRYRKRHDTYQAARDDQQRVRDLWEAGEDLPAPSASPAAPTAHTILSAKDVGYGTLWDGQAQEETCWAHIVKMASILGSTTTLDTIDTVAVDRIVKHLKSAGAQNGTINRYLSHLRTFLDWCRKRKLTTVAVADIEFSWAKEAQGRIRWITPAEEAELEEHLPTNVWHLVKVAIETGCRRGELLAVELGQINGNRLHLWKTKTDSPRTVYMEPEITALLTGLVTTGTLPTRNYLRRQWEKAKGLMGLMDDADFVFHACRHTRATRLVEASVDIRVIKEMLGHKQIETTMRYAHVKASNIEDAMEKVGEYSLRSAKKAQSSAIPTVPHPAPLGGGITPDADYAEFLEWRKSRVLVRPEGFEPPTPRLGNKHPD